MYCENQENCNIIDYQGNEYTVKDKTGCCIVPTTYVLGKALEYADLISDNSSKRSKYKEWKMEDLEFIKKFSKITISRYLWKEKNK